LNLSLCGIFGLSMAVSLVLGGISKLRTIFLDMGVKTDYNKVFIISIRSVSSLEVEAVYRSCMYEIDCQLTRLLVGR